MSKKKVSYRTAWETQVKAHASTVSHSEKERLLSGKTSQRVLVTKDSNNVVLSEESSAMSFSDQVLNAEILRALDVVQSNHSFANTNGDNELHRRMFTGSKIAQSYQQGETKTKYVIQFGIALHLRKQMIEDFNYQPFTFKFDETTTSQVKKQYDGYVQYWSNSQKLVVNRFAKRILFL